MRFSKAFVLVAFAALGWLACNPGDFNSVLDKAPVVDFGAPGSSTGSLSVLPLPPPTDVGTKVAARMLIARNANNYLGVADFDMNGKVALHEDAAAESNLGYPVYSSAVRADGNILVGTPSFGGDPPPGRVSMLTPVASADGSVTYAVQVGITGTSHLGIAVAAGSITGLAGGDFVAVGDDIVQLLGASPTTPSARTPVGCQTVQLGNTVDPYASRPVVVADLLTGGLDEIALGGQVAGQGEVVLVQYDGTNVLPCPKTILTLGAVGSFGTSLAAGDFDGDGFKDLAVGAPPDRVYVYFGPLDNVTAPSVTIASATATGFGKSIATYYMPGQATAQLLVADPGATVGQRAGAGQVLLFNIARGSATISSAAAVAVFFDSNQDSDTGLFGLNLGGMQFNKGICSSPGAVQLVPWASLGPDILTFFAYSANGAPPDDPRCFAQPK